MTNSNNPFSANRNLFGPNRRISRYPQFQPTMLRREPPSKRVIREVTDIPPIETVTVELPKPQSVTRLDLGRFICDKNDKFDIDNRRSHDTDINYAYKDGHHVVLIGDPGLGKTSLASWFFDYNALIITDIAHLSQFDRNVHTGIIFREVDLSPLTYRELDILTNDKSKLVTTNGREVLIPAATILFFTTSKPDGHIIPQSWVPLRKRMQKFSVTRPTFVDEEIEDKIINITP